MLRRGSFNISVVGDWCTCCICLQVQAILGPVVACVCVCVCTNTCMGTCVCFNLAYACDAPLRVWYRRLSTWKFSNGRLGTGDAGFLGLFLAAQLTVCACPAGRLLGCSRRSFCAWRESRRGGRPPRFWRCGGGAGLRRCLLLLLPLLAVANVLVHEKKPMFGRLHEEHPVKHCCMGADCTARSRGRHAFVTSMRSADPKYLVGLRELHCSLKKTNPGVPLVVLGVEGELDEAMIAGIKELGRHRVVDDIIIPNNHDGVTRYRLGWVKLRPFEWEDYDALIFIDADVVVLGDLTHLFDLPTHFAWATLNGHSGYDWNRGGVTLLRPCQATFDAMMRVVS